MKRYGMTIALIIAFASVGAACSGGGGSGASPSTPAGATTTTTTTTIGTTPPATSSGGSTATIVAQNFAFSPAAVTLAPGQVTLTVTNKDTAEHTFTLDDGSSDTDLPPGQTVTITLSLTKTVGWHCKIHPSMTGTLTAG
jgi:plastocyanin